MKVLVACEYSARVRDAFRALGHDAWSCDFLECEGDPQWHFQCDVRKVIDNGWDLMIAHPDCTYLTVSGLHWNKHVPGRVEKTDPEVRAGLTEEAVEFFRFLLEADIPRIAVENPVGLISSRIRKPDQIIQPWQYGHPESKKTCLWLKGLPLLEPTNILTPTKFQDNGQPQWDNQTPTGQNKLAPSADRWKIRSRTYEGIALAMADQWGGKA